MKFEFNGVNIVGMGSLALSLPSFEIHTPSSQRPSFYCREVRGGGIKGKEGATLYKRTSRPWLYW